MGVGLAGIGFDISAKISMPVPRGKLVDLHPQLFQCSSMIGKMRELE
jgi:hypothetical protein